MPSSQRRVPSEPGCSRSAVLGGVRGGEQKAGKAEREMCTQLNSPEGTVLGRGGGAAPAAGAGGGMKISARGFIDECNAEGKAARSWGGASCALRKQQSDRLQRSVAQ